MLYFFVLTLDASGSCSTLSTKNNNDMNKSRSPEPMDTSENVSSKVTIDGIDLYVLFLLLFFKL